MPKESTNILDAAEFLAQRRLSPRHSTRLPAELRPQTSEKAWAIQQAQTELLEAQGETVGGWKCALPSGDKWIVAPIFSSTIQHQSPVPLFVEDGVCKFEPEIGFTLQHDLPPRQQGYTNAEIIDALASAHPALELIQNRNWPEETASFYEHLADNLFNQGLFVGQAIPLETALNAAEISFTLHTKQPEVPVEQTIAGKHPHGLPQTPLFWLVNFLSQQGITLKAGQIIITGTYAGLLKLPPNQDFTLQYGDWAALELTFTPR